MSGSIPPTSGISARKGGLSTAIEAGVPLLESPPLARALYRHVELEQEIPAALYAAVAQVLAWVYQLQQHAAGRAARPAEPGIVLPPGLDPQEADR